MDPRPSRASFIVGLIAAAILGAAKASAQSAAPVREAANALSEAGPGSAKSAAARPSIRWSGETPSASRTIDAAYLEIEAALAAREEADRHLRDAVVPLQGETIRQADGSMRYLPVYYDRIAPFERAAMLANDRLDRANAELGSARQR